LDEWTPATKTMMDNTFFCRKVHVVTVAVSFLDLCYFSLPFEFVRSMLAFYFWFIPPFHRSSTFILLCIVFNYCWRFKCRP
jgi:hypothetical protein